MLERSGQVAYMLVLLATTRIHVVFHISPLKLFKGDVAEPYLLLPLTSIELSPILQLVAMLQVATNKHYLYSSTNSLNSSSM